MLRRKLFAALGAILSIPILARREKESSLRQEPPCGYPEDGEAYVPNDTIHPSMIRSWSHPDPDFPVNHYVDMTEKVMPK